MSTEERITALERKVKEIGERNKRVEADKAWETSWARKILIAAVTYFTIAVFFLVNQFPDPFLGAIVPTLGFILSTLTLSLLKNIWLKKFNS